MLELHDARGPERNDLAQVREPASSRRPELLVQRRLAGVVQLVG
jgi:hypothetical protein